MSDRQPREYPGLHNVVAYHDGYYSGSVPEGAAGFQSLADLGVKTIISVDGAPPDLASARAHNLRYIHLPIGYDGVSEERSRQLARATRDALRAGPVYIHCHHGKHRSAGAAAVVAVGLGWSTPEEAQQRMRVSGTSPNYSGLYACVAGATALSSDAVDAIADEFPEIAHPSGMVKAMLEIDAAYEHLKLIEQAGWTVPATHPDLVPAAEAGQLANIYRYLETVADTQARPPGFRLDLQKSRLEAEALENALIQSEREPIALTNQLLLITASCKRCHSAYRD